MRGTFMKRIKKIIQIGMIGGLSAIALGALVGCGEDNTASNQQIKQGAFVIIEEVSPGEYKIKDQFPSDETRVVLQALDGSERVLTKEEMDKLIKDEAAKIDNGTSNLTKDNAQISSGGGLGLGEAILASAAGAILGSWIGSKLFNNQNFANQQRGAFSNQSAYQRSVNNFNNAGGTKASSSTKSGFFGGGSKATSSSSFGS